MTDIEIEDVDLSRVEPDPFHEQSHTNGRAPHDHATDGAPSPFEGLTHDQALELEISEERQLIQDLIPLGAVGTIAGVPETHKSWLAQQIAVTVAKGEGEVLGCQVAGQHPVGYFWQDDSTREELERIKTYEQANTARGTPLHWFLNQNVTLPDDTARLAATVHAHSLGLLVLDSFYNFLPGQDLKDEGAERIVAQLKRDLADQTGCTILIVDHMPWATDTNRQRLRAYGGVFKNAATRYGIYIDANGTNLSIEARGNNIRGFKKRPAYWDSERLELHLIETPGQDEREAQEADALTWIVNHIADIFTETGAGIARGKVEEAYHIAHGGKGRNLARRIIDRGITAYKQYEDDVLLGNGPTLSGELQTPFATTTGESPRGTYLKPFTHADSPLAAPPNGDTGEYPPQATERDPFAAFATPSIREGAAAANRDEASDDLDFTIPHDGPTRRI